MYKKKKSEKKKKLGRRKASHHSLGDAGLALLLSGSKACDFLLDLDDGRFEPGWNHGGKSAKEETNFKYE